MPERRVTPAEAAARALHNLLQTEIPVTARMSWEKLPEWQREQTRVLVRCVLTAYRAAGGNPGK
jgi:hypothetical protein